MTKQQPGIIIVPPGAFITKHEKLAADYLATSLGHNITFLISDRHNGFKTSDIKMIGRNWEIKSPSGKSPRTIENNLRLALKQSPYIIVDLRRMDGRIPTKKLLTEIERQFTLSRSIKRIIVITRQQQHIDIKR